MGGWGLVNALKKNDAHQVRVGSSHLRRPHMPLLVSETFERCESVVSALAKLRLSAYVSHCRHVDEAGRRSNACLVSGEVGPSLLRAVRASHPDVRVVVPSPASEGAAWP